MAFSIKLLTKRMCPVTVHLRSQATKNNSNIVSKPPTRRISFAIDKDQNLPDLYRHSHTPYSIPPERHIGSGDHPLATKNVITNPSCRWRLPNYFWPLQSQRNDDVDKEKARFKLLKNITESLPLRGKRDKPNNEKRRIPKLILLQNPFSWLMIKIDFTVLRNIWDPTFQEKEFRFGTKQAISRITHLISTGKYSDLNGLLTKAARLSLMRELDRNWSDKQRSLLALKRDDIQISSPRKVYFIRIADKKYCDVDMAFLALKWAPINDIDSLIFAEIFARFHREYTPHCIPEWTVAFFKVTRFEVLRR